MKPLLAQKISGSCFCFFGQVIVRVYVLVLSYLHLKSELFPFFFSRQTIQLFLARVDSDFSNLEMKLGVTHCAVHCPQSIEVTTTTED